MITRRDVVDSTPRSGFVDERSSWSPISDETLTLTSGTSPTSFLTASYDERTYDNNAGRTSCYSFREDRFDRLASDSVLLMFEAIDSELYEEDISASSHKSPRPTFRIGRTLEKSRVKRASTCTSASNSGQILRNECINELKSAFPHFRICGVSMSSASDEGVQLYSREVDASQMSSASLSENQGLNIGCRQIDQQRLSVTGKNVETFCHAPAIGSFQSSFEEEVFEIDGKMEEIIAIDYRNCDEFTQRPKIQQWGGIPPVTPLECVRSNIVDSVFDEAWKEVTFQLLKFLRRHCGLEDFRMKEFSKPRLNTASSCRLRSLDHHAVRSSLYEPPLERLSSAPEKSLSYPVNRNRNPLTNLLRIQPKALTTREKLDPNVIPVVSGSGPTGSSAASNILFLQLTGNSTHPSDSVTSPGRRNVTRERLEAIHDNDDDSSVSLTTATIEVRGHGLHGSTRIDPLSSLSIFPPINSELQRVTSGGHLGNRIPARRLSYRVNSAVMPKAGRFLSERPATQSTLRPITGETFKLEISAIPTTNRRYSTINPVGSKRNICMLESMLVPPASDGQPRVRGIGLQRYHTVIS